HEVELGTRMPLRQVGLHPRHTVRESAKLCFLSGDREGVGGDIDRGDGPAVAREPQGVAALAAAEFEGGADREASHLVFDGGVHATAPHPPTLAAVTDVALLPERGGVVRLSFRHGSRVRRASLTGNYPC